MTDLFILGSIAFLTAAGGIFLLRHAPGKPSRRDQRIDVLLDRLEKAFPEDHGEDENSISLTARESARILEMLDNPPPLHPELRRMMIEDLVRKSIRSEERAVLLASFIDGLIETLAKCPDLRIGQAISNAVATPPETDLFNCPDVFLASLIRLEGAGSNDGKA